MNCLRRFALWSAVWATVVLGLIEKIPENIKRT